MNAVQVTLPRRGKGNQSFASIARYEQEMRDFAAAISQIASQLQLSRKPGVRGWCYILEEHGLTKDEFPLIARRITRLRKSGLLPIDICGEDEARVATDHSAPDHSEFDDEREFADTYFEHYAKRGREAVAEFTPIPWAKGLDYEVFVMVEKSDLVTLFEGVCAEYHVSIGNAKGWGDLHSRAALMRRFQQAEAEGRQPVLLYCGDHDPTGLQISGTLKSMLRELKDAVGWDPSNVIVSRFGLNADFIEALGLTWIEGLKTSSGKDLGNDDADDEDSHFLARAEFVQDYIAKYGKRKVEANALIVRPEAAEQLMRDTLAEYIPVDWPQQHVKRNAKARRAALAAYDKLAGRSA